MMQHIERCRTREQLGGGQGFWREGHLQLLLVYLPQMLIFFYCPACDESEYGDVSSLAQAKRAVLRLQVPAESVR